MGQGRAPCCDKSKVKKGPWSPIEDLKLINFIKKYGHDNWRALPKEAGLLRCGKSCRLRWINYLRPDVKRGNFTKEEEDTIIKQQQTLGNKWSKIAAELPGRTDNEIKNVWNTHLKKRSRSKGNSFTTSSSSTSSASQQRSASVNGCTSVRIEDNKLDLDVSKYPRIFEKERSYNHIRPMRQPLQLSSSSISSSSSSTTNSSQVIEARSDPEALIDSVFNHEENYNIWKEVNLTEILETSATEVPFETEFGFWNMLDGLSSFLSGEQQSQNNEATQSYLLNSWPSL